MLFCHSSRCLGLSVTTLPFELCQLPGVAACECVILAPRPPNSHHLCNVRHRFHQGLGCLDEPLARPRVLLRTHSHVLRVSRALLATVSTAWSWIPPCRVWSTFVRRRERLVAGASASKVYIANGDLHLSPGFALLCFPRSYTRLLWFVVLCFGPRAAVPPKLSLFDSPRLSPLRLLCASWSVDTTRRRHACMIDGHHVRWSHFFFSTLTAFQSRLPIVSLHGSFLTARVATSPRETPS